MNHQSLLYVIFFIGQRRALLRKQIHILCEGILNNGRYRAFFRCLGILLLLPIMGMSQTPLDLKLDTLLSHSVPMVYENELTQILAQKKIILLDTRTKEEYEVSHINGADFVGYDTFTPDMVKNLDKSRLIVVYCSVGYRSEKIGEKLLELGFTNVQNLYGGIFEWKNHEHTVVNSHNIPTDSVHTYNSHWAIFLKKGIKVYD